MGMTSSKEKNVFKETDSDNNRNENINVSGTPDNAPARTRRDNLFSSSYVDGRWSANRSRENTTVRCTYIMASQSSNELISLLQETDPTSGMSFLESVLRGGQELESLEYKIRALKVDPKALGNIIKQDINRFAEVFSDIFRRPDPIHCRSIIFSKLPSEVQNSLIEQYEKMKSKESEESENRLFKP